MEPYDGPDPLLLAGWQQPAKQKMPDVKYVAPDSIAEQTSWSLRAPRNSIFSFITW